MPSDPQLALSSLSDDVSLRALSQLIRLFIVEFCELQFEEEAVVGYFTRLYSHLPGGFDENHEGEVIAVPAGVWTGKQKLTARADLLGGGGQVVTVPRFQDDRHIKEVRLAILRTGHHYLPGTIPVRD
jgi:hypothetical protein